MLARHYRTQPVDDLGCCLGMGARAVCDPYDSASSSRSMSPISLNTDGDTRRKSSATLTLTFAFLRRSTTLDLSFMVKLIRAEVDSGGVSGANPSRGISSRSFFKSVWRCA